MPEVKVENQKEQDKAAEPKAKQPHVISPAPATVGMASPTGR